MEQESCKVELLKDKKYGWKLRLQGDCSEILNDINEGLGKYNKRFLNERLLFESKRKAIHGKPNEASSLEGIQ